MFALVSNLRYDVIVPTILAKGLVAVEGERLLVRFIIETDLANERLFGLL
jgi:hypothetical protein